MLGSQHLCLQYIDYKWLLRGHGKRLLVLQHLEHQTFVRLIGMRLPCHLML